MKAKAAAEVGFNFKHVTVAAETSAQDVVEIIRKLNADEQVSGILVQLPLGDHVTPEGERLVTEAISPEKDVDGCVTHPIYLPLSTHLSNMQIPCLQHWPSFFPGVCSTVCALHPCRSHSAS